MNTLQRGDATEAALISALADRGFTVLTPFSRSSPFDLAVVLPENRFLRIQCKCGRLRDGCVVFNTMAPITEVGYQRLRVHLASDYDVTRWTVARLQTVLEPDPSAASSTARQPDLIH